MEKLLTVFTPTFNRAHTICRTYKSLCQQTCKDFEWLVVDDGSTDNTFEIIQKWISQGVLSIRYIKKENEGLHTAYTSAIANIHTELNICIDSDDYMPNNAVEIIEKTWKERSLEHKNIAGIIGLDFKLDGTPIGGNFTRFDNAHFYELCRFHKGDTKIVCRTDLLKELPIMPIFKGEKNFNPVYYYMQVDIDNTFIIVNQNLCFVDYQNEGMSASIFYQYKNSPKSFAQLRRLAMSLPYVDLKNRFRNAVHYVSSCIFSKQWNMVSSSPKPFLTVLAFPFGCLLNMFIRYKTKN